MRHVAPILMLAAASLAACQRTAADKTQDSVVIATAAAGATGRMPPEWTRHAAVYEVNVRQFTPEGTFPALQRHLPRLDSLGVDILWLMPVQPIGRKNRKGGLGSYYSIADYRAVNPEYGTAADFRAFVDAAHAQGLRVILDWVANHTAWDHPWIAQHPDWYTRKANGEISFPLDAEGRETDWTDVAELNFDNREMRRQMLADMRFWIDSMKVDGFRCDVAWGVPADFWAEARRELQGARPDVFLLAEAEGPELHASFDASYGWEMHHLLNAIIQGKKPLAELDAYQGRQDRAYPERALRMYFTSNHDENSWQGTEFERMGADHQSAFVLSAAWDQSLPLVYTGQEASLRKRLRFFEKDTVDWRGPSLAPFYRRVLALKDSVPALENGPWGGTQARLATTGAGADEVYAFVRTKGASTAIVAVNFGGRPARASYSGLAAAGEYRDWFDGSRLPLAASGELEIAAHGYRVLVR